jgi:hypothetical protein
VISSNAFGNLDDNSGSGNTTNALWLTGLTATASSVHINGNTIPLGFDTPPGAGAPTLAVSTASTLTIGPGQNFVGRNLGTLGVTSGTLNINGSNFDSLNGIPVQWGGIIANSNTNLNLNLTNTTISHGASSLSGPTANPAQLTCLSCNLTLSRTIVSDGVDGGITSTNFGPTTQTADHVDVVGNAGTGITGNSSLALTAVIVSGNPTGISGAVSVSHSDVTGTVPAGIVGVNGNIALDPLFTSATSTGPSIPASRRQRCRSRSSPTPFRPFPTSIRCRRSTRSARPPCRLRPRPTRSPVR